MRTFAWLARVSLYVLVAATFGCGDGEQSRDAEVGGDAGPDVRQDAARSDAGPLADVAADVADAAPIWDGTSETAGDGASTVDSSGDAQDGGARACWYERARTGAGLPTFGFSFVAPDGVTYACSADPRQDAGPPWPRDLRGVVTKVSASQFTLDTCQAQDACDPGVYTFMVNAPGLALTLPVGRKVRVQWQIAVPWGCTSWLQVSDDTSDASGMLWLVGNDGYQEPPFELPFDVRLDQLASCRHPADAQPSCSGARTGDYAFKFSSKVGASTLSLGTMDSGSFTFQDATGGAKTMDIHCLQAFQTVMCDDYWSWNFWAVSPPTTGAPVDAGGF